MEGRQVLILRIVGIPVVAWKRPGGDRGPTVHTEGIRQSKFVAPVCEVGQRALMIRIAIDRKQSFAQEVWAEDMGFGDGSCVNIGLG